MNALDRVLWKVLWFLAIAGAMIVMTVVHVWVKYIRKPKSAKLANSYPIWAVHEHASDPPATSSTRPPEGS